MLSEADKERWQTIAAAISSGLSLIGSVYMLGRYWYVRRMVAKSPSLSSLHNLEITKELVCVLAWLDFINAIARILGPFPAKTFDQDKGEPVTNICKVQAFVITFGDGALVAWNLALAFHLFRWVCVGEDQRTLHKRIKWYIFYTGAAGFIVPIVALAYGKFGDAVIWCWIVTPNNRTVDLWWKLGALYIWVILAAIVMIVLMVLVTIDLKKRLQSYENEDAREAYNAVVRNMTLYIVGYIVCWIPAIVNRANSAITGHDSFVLAMFHTSIVTLQGFVNAVIYGKFHIWVGRHMRAADGSRMNEKHSSKPSRDPQLKNSVSEAEERHHRGTASIFITTFDMSWNTFPSNLDDWIPPKKDLYVFSLQHCIDVQQVEQSIQKYLLRVNYPTAYRSIMSLAGSAFRGQTQNASVCQILFVNNADDASGNFQFHAVDGRMWAQRKTFKEVAGIPIRYFDASMAFVSCDLAPRHRAHETRNDITAKHSTSTKLIHSFGMDADNAIIDFPNLYHHTFLSGNLNYDVRMSKPALAAAIDQAYKAECLKRATDSAIESKLKTIRETRLEKNNLDQNARPRYPRALHQDNLSVPVNWNLLYLKSQDSLGRSSESTSSTVDDIIYREVYSSSTDDLPFTLLESPSASLSTYDNDEMDFKDSTLADIESVNGEFSRIFDDHSIAINESDHQRGENESPKGRRSWTSFLSNLFPPELGTKHVAQLSISGRRFGANGRANSNGNTRAGNKRISDLLLRSQVVAENSAAKWKNLLRFDELHAAIEAKEVFCGFEEPPIQFLPSYPRRVGAGASFAIVTERSCKDLFVDMSFDPSKPSQSPAYKGRILAHSLQDTRQRIRNIGYWLCEEIVTSSHMPVCSLYELEIDRFFAYKMAQTAVFDTKDTLRDKIGVREFKIKLVNLDANIWTYVAEQRGIFSYHSSRTGMRHGVVEYPESMVAYGREEYPRNYDSSSSSSEESMSSRRSLVASGKHRSLSKVMSRIFSKDRSEPMGSSVSRTTTPTLYSDFTTGSGDSRDLTSTDDQFSSLSPTHLELAPVKPLNIATVFPLPSEDVYSLQRKMYEVAHFVQNGFQSSTINEEIEESQLAYTNFRTVPWKEASRSGVAHSAVTMPVNGGVHIAITIEAENGHGGQGVLCIREEDIVSHVAQGINDVQPIPFDVTLTWGGKHVGYLHGGILACVI